MTQRQRQCKVACNATNSAAVDSEGTLYVWGSGKYGLLGNHMQNLCYSVPKPLFLKKDDRNMDHDAFTTTNKHTQFKVKDVAMGQYHMAALAEDAEVLREFVQLDYALDIFAKLRTYLIEVKFKAIQRKGLPENFRRKYNITDKDKIEIALENCFQED